MIRDKKTHYTTPQCAGLARSDVLGLDYDQSKGAVNENSEAKTIHNGEKNLGARVHVTL